MNGVFFTVTCITGLFLPLSRMHVVRAFFHGLWPYLSAAVSLKPESSGFLQLFPNITVNAGVRHHIANVLLALCLQEAVHGHPLSYLGGSLIRANRMPYGIHLKR